MPHYDPYYHVCNPCNDQNPIYDPTTGVCSPCQQGKIYDKSSGRCLYVGGSSAIPVEQVQGVTAVNTS